MIDDEGLVSIEIDITLERSCVTVKAPTRDIVKALEGVAKLISGQGCPENASDLGLTGEVLPKN